MPTRIAPHGEVWRPGRHFEVLEVLPPTNHPTDVTASLLLRIWREGQVYDLRAQPFVPGNPVTGWAVLDTLPEHPCLLPVLHSYSADEPVLDPSTSPSSSPVGHRPGPCLFLLQPVEGIPVPQFVAKYQATQPAPPFGLTWRWVAQLLRGMLRCLRFLQSEHVVHGCYRLDNFLLQDSIFTQLEPQVRLSGFHNAWVTVGSGGRRTVWGAAADLEALPLGGRGSYRAPEVYRALDSLVNRSVFCVTPSESLPKAELWSIGRCVYELLCPGARDTVFDRLATLKDHSYNSEDLPPLPSDVPPWLALVLTGLVRADDRLRINLEDALQVLDLGLAIPERTILSVVEKLVKVPVPVDRVVEKVVEVPRYVDRVVEKHVEKIVDRIVEVMVEVPQPVSGRETASPQSLTMMEPKMEKIIEVQEIVKMVEVEKVVRVPYILEVVTRPASGSESPGRYLHPKIPGPDAACMWSARELLQPSEPLQSCVDLDRTPPCSPKTTYLRSPSRPITFSGSPDPPQANGNYSSYSSPLRPSSVWSPPAPAEHQIVARRAKTKKSSRAPSQERASGNLSGRDKKGSAGNLLLAPSDSSALSSRKGSVERTPRQKAKPYSQSAYDSASQGVSPRTNSPRLTTAVSPRSTPPLRAGSCLPGDSKPRDELRPFWNSGVAVPMGVDQLEIPHRGATGGGPPTFDPATGTTCASRDTGRSCFNRFMDTFFAEKGRLPYPSEIPLMPDMDTSRRNTPSLAYLPSAQNSRRTSPALTRINSGAERPDRPRRSPLKRDKTETAPRGRAKSPAAANPSSSPKDGRLRAPDPRPGVARRRGASLDKGE